VEVFVQEHRQQAVGSAVLVVDSHQAKLGEDGWLHGQVHVAGRTYEVMFLDARWVLI
jgi:hypothetical protein